MRVIERGMVNAIHEGKDFRRDNTVVVYDEVWSTGRVYLFGNEIVRFSHMEDPITRKKEILVQPNLETIRNWPTPTTLSRLRAMGVNVRKEQGVVYLNNRSIEKEVAGA